MLKLVHHKVDCLLLRNAHKITRQAALNVCTESAPVCVHLSKVNKLPYDTTTLDINRVDIKNVVHTSLNFDSLIRFTRYAFSELL